MFQVAFIVMPLTFVLTALKTLFMFILKAHALILIHAMFPIAISVSIIKFVLPVKQDTQIQLEDVLLAMFRIVSTALLKMYVPAVSTTIY